MEFTIKSIMYLSLFVNCELYIFYVSKIYNKLLWVHMKYTFFSLKELIVKHLPIHWPKPMPNSNLACILLLIAEFSPSVTIFSPHIEIPITFGFTKIWVFFLSYLLVSITLNHIDNSLGKYVFSLFLWWARLLPIIPLPGPESGNLFCTPHPPPM